MGSTFGWLGVVERFDVFALADHLKSLFGNIYICHDILPFVLFADEELVLGGEGNPAALANETNKGYL
jgi:hypothetical protein